jgi:flagellar hook-associated protein 1 FlgK
MSNSFTILALAGQNLGAHRAAAATASNNLQNVNTPGYSRQTAIIQENPGIMMDGVRVGTGAQAVDIVQNRNPFAEAQMPLARGDSFSANAQADALEGVNALDPLATGNVSDSLGAFFESLRQLAQNPGDAGYRAAALAAADQLATSFNRTASGISQARSAMDATLTANASEANGLAAQVASLNTQITVARNTTGATPNDLLDLRQVAMDRLSELTGARPVPDGDGNVSMVLQGGQPLVVGDRAARFSTLPDATNNGLAQLRLTRADGTVVPLDAAQLGGSMGGTLAARDGTMRNAATSVDNLAWDVAGAINAVHTAGVGLDGVGGRNLLDPGATATGAASRIKLSSDVAGNPSALAAATTAAGLPGGSDNVLALLGVENQSMASTGKTAVVSFGALVAEYGAKTSAARQDASAKDARLSMVTALREAASGVSVDEELVALTQAQRAFEAAMRVVTTADDMLKTLMNMT